MNLHFFSASLIIKLLKFSSVTFSLHSDATPSIIPHLLLLSSRHLCLCASIIAHCLSIFFIWNLESISHCIFMLARLLSAEPFSLEMQSLTKPSLPWHCLLAFSQFCLWCCHSLLHCLL